MSDLSPKSRLDVTIPELAFGQITYLGDSLSWNLPGYFGNTTAQFQGFQLDPTGSFLTQQYCPQWQNGTDWTHSAGTFTTGVDTATKKTIFVHPARSESFNAVNGYARPADESFSVKLYRGAPATGQTNSFYLEFSRGVAAGTEGLRLAIEQGAPIRLQSTTDYINWTDCAVASGLGESEAYLSQVRRMLTLDVQSQCDPSFYAGEPQSLAISDAPPSQIVVVINGGDAILTYRPPGTLVSNDDGTKSVTGYSMQSGKLAAIGANGAWSIEVARGYWLANASATLPEQTRPTPFVGDPDMPPQGYIPYGDSVVGTVNLTGTNRATGQLSVAVTEGLIGGLAVRTVLLSSLDAIWAMVYTPPATFIPQYSYYPVYTVFNEEWDQKTGMWRQRATMVFDNTLGQMDPNVIVAGARAGQLYMGYADDPNGLQPQMTGWLSLAAESGQEWAWDKARNFFTVTLEDKFRRGDADQKSIGYDLPYDGQADYYFQEKMCAKMGISPYFLTFPLVGRNQDSPFYYLPRGTNLEPILKFQPSMPINSARALVMQKLAAEYDPDTQQLEPMVMGTEPLGDVIYEPFPPGISQAFLDPTSTLPQLSLTSAQDFYRGAAFNADNEPLLNELLDSGLVSSIGLSTIRTTAVFEGIDNISGGAVYGIASNPQLGGGALSDPNQAGYIGLDIEFFDINKVIASQQVAELAAYKASIQFAFPASRIDLKVHLQPYLRVMDVITVTDPYTLGGDPVDGVFPATPFYTTSVTKIINSQSGAEITQETLIRARLLGESG